MPSPGRLLVLSHRGPVDGRRNAAGTRPRQILGGLPSALDAAMQRHGGMWVASATRADGLLTPAETGLGYDIRSVRLKEREASTFYAGFANQVLWPLCHMFPHRCRFQPAFWAAYHQANERFAAVVRAEAAAGDRVWVNDFHLALVPGMLRTAGAPGPMGVFWHLPFPPPSVFGVCPWRAELLAGMLGADVIGLQTDGDVQNFLDCVRHFLDLPVDQVDPRVRLPGRDVRVVALPVGIEAAHLRQQADDPDVRAHATPLRDGMNLVAKEYVACHSRGDGILILSEFAGAARELTEALPVNPYDPEAIRRQMDRALAMPPEERRTRMSALARKVAAHDVHWWTSQFLELLQ